MVTSPFGINPYAASPFGAGQFGASPFGASPFGASPFGASPFGGQFGGFGGNVTGNPFGAGQFGVSPFGGNFIPPYFTGQIPFFPGQQINPIFQFAPGVSANFGFDVGALGSVPAGEYILPYIFRAIGSVQPILTYGGNGFFQYF